MLLMARVSAALLLIVSAVAVSNLARADESQYDAFYTPPDPLPAGQPGVVIRSEPSRLVLEPSGQLGAFEATGTRIMYLSTDTHGRPDVVTGTYASADRTSPVPADASMYIPCTVGLPILELPGKTCTTFTPRNPFCCHAGMMISDPAPSISKCNRSGTSQGSRKALCSASMSFGQGVSARSRSASISTDTIPWLYFAGAGGAKGCCSRAGLGKITKSRCACCSRLSPMVWSAVCSSGRLE